MSTFKIKDVFYVYSYNKKVCVSTVEIKEVFMSTIEIKEVSMYIAK